jgi:hypothetical protein
LSSAATFASNWATLLAPMITLVIRGSRSAQDRASWASVWPRPAAIPLSARTVVMVASSRSLSLRKTLVRTRESAGTPSR